MPAVITIEDDFEEMFSDARYAIFLFTVDMPDTTFEKSFYEAAEIIGDQIQFMKSGYQPGVQQALAQGFSVPISYFPIVMITDMHMKTEIYP